METESIDDYNFASSSTIMELDSYIHPHHIIDSDMVSPHADLPDQYDYDQVMMSFEDDDHQPASNDDDPEVEMSDDRPFSDSVNKPATTESASLPPLPTTTTTTTTASTSLTIPQEETVLTEEIPLEKTPQATVAGFSELVGLQSNDSDNHHHLTLPISNAFSQQPNVDEQQQFGTLLSSSNPQLPLINSPTEPTNNLTSENNPQTQDQMLPLSGSSLTKPDLFSAESTSHSIAPVPSSSVVQDPSVSDILPGSPSSSVTLNPPLVLEPEKISSEEQETILSCDDVERSLPDQETVPQASSEQPVQVEPEVQPGWENPLVEEEIPYDDLEPDSRPKVRTDLLEHVQVEFGSCSLDDPILSTQQEAVTAPGVRLICEGCEYSLFKRIEPYSDPDPEDSAQSSIDGETILLSEPEYRDLYFGPLEAFIQSLHNIFPNLHDSNKNELVLNFPALEIKVPEDNVYAKELSLFDVDRLHVGARLPDRLLISLEKQPRLVHRFNILANYVSELANNQNSEENVSVGLVQDQSDVSTANDNTVIRHAQPPISEEVASSFAHLVSVPAVSADKSEVISSTINQAQQEATTTDPTSSQDKIVELSLNAPEASALPLMQSSASSSALTNEKVTDLAHLKSEASVRDSAPAQATQVEQAQRLTFNVNSEARPTTPSKEITFSHDSDKTKLETNDESVDTQRPRDSGLGNIPEPSSLIECTDLPDENNEENVEEEQVYSSTSDLTVRDLDQLSEGEVPEMSESQAEGLSEGQIDELPEGQVEEPSESQINEEPSESQINKEPSEGRVEEPFESQVEELANNFSDHNSVPLSNPETASFKAGRISSPSVPRHELPDENHKLISGSDFRGRSASITPTSHGSSKRSRSQVEDQLESDVAIDLDGPASSCLDLKKPRVMF